MDQPASSGNPAIDALEALDKILGSAIRRAYDPTEVQLIGPVAGNLLNTIRAALAPKGADASEPQKALAPPPARPPRRRK